jgi:hypothetical protein
MNARFVADARVDLTLRSGWVETERYTQDAQTVIDMSTPEEMRWLAMFRGRSVVRHGLAGRFAHWANPAWALASQRSLGAQLARGA